MPEKQATHEPSPTAALVVLAVAGMILALGWVRLGAEDRVRTSLRVAAYVVVAAVAAAGMVVAKVRDREPANAGRAARIVTYVGAAGMVVGLVVARSDTAAAAYVMAALGGVLLAVSAMIFHNATLNGGNRAAERAPAGALDPDDHAA